MNEENIERVRKIGKYFFYGSIFSTFYITLKEGFISGLGASIWIIVGYWLKNFNKPSKFSPKKLFLKILDMEE